MVTKSQRSPVLIIFTNPRPQRELEDVVTGVTGTSHCFFGEYSSNPLTEGAMPNLNQAAVIASVPLFAKSILRSAPEILRVYDGQISEKAIQRYSHPVQEACTFWNRYHRTLYK